MISRVSFFIFLNNSLARRNKNHYNSQGKNTSSFGVWKISSNKSAIQTLDVGRVGYSNEYE
ncbi:hypothetical protein J8TS2_18080 [Lederbergia ruris]|uniref:Uncharacterized protein n=1 Tax=Lederbergia ruris TaxID=217495 RepID=A0ABQ4KK40_9BACI|nr:hypothetical protein J8TS2_18080 [Lederbergia ruris]